MNWAFILRKTFVEIVQINNRKIIFIRLLCVYCMRMQKGIS